MDRAALRSVERQPGVPPAIAGLPGRGRAAGRVPGATGVATGPRSRQAAEATVAGSCCSSRRVHPRFRRAGTGCGRCGRGCSRPWAPSASAGRAPSSRTWRSPSSAWPMPPSISRACSPRTATPRRSSSGTPATATSTSSSRSRSTSRPAIDRLRAVHGRPGRAGGGQYDGALKAEHGTGRNMAPFVETEWGAEAYWVMRA
jgi:hypothetical protein